MTRLLNRMQPWGVVLLRFVLGAAMIYNGWDKVYPAGGFHGHVNLSALHGFCHYVKGLGLPYWTGYVSAFAETVGGFCLLIGLFVRFFALLIAGNMLVAIAVVNLHHGYSGSEYSLALLGIGLMLVLTGPGTLALDRRMGLH